MTTLAQLTTRVAQLLGRDDASDAPLAEFINTAADRISRSIRVPSLETPTTVTITSGYFTIPSDLTFVKLVYPALTTYATEQLEPVPLSEFRRWQRLTGDPVYYNQVGGRIYVAPVPPDNTQLGLVYWRTDASMANPGDTCALSAFGADALVYGALYEAAIHFDDERADRFEAEYQKRKSEVETASADFYASLAPAYQRSYLAEIFDV